MSELPGQVRFDGQVAIVTGSGRGMGRCHALELARRGANVVVNDLPTGDRGGAAVSQSAADVVAEIVAAGGTAVAAAVDISTRAGCFALIEAAVERFGRLDAIIHNAGIVRPVAIEAMTEQELDKTVRVHLYAGVYLTSAAWPRFKSQGGGRVLFITSAAGLYGVPGFTHYGPAKTGLLSLARIVTIEGEQLGIHANVLGVSAMTSMMEAMFAEDTFADRADEADWWRTHMRPEQTTPAALWLIHPDCPASGRAYESRGGRVARILIVENRGYLNPDHTVEDIRDHFDAIEDMSDWLFVERSADLLALERSWHDERDRASAGDEAAAN